MSEHDDYLPVFYGPDSWAEEFEQRAAFYRDPAGSPR